VVLLLLDGFASSNDYYRRRNLETYYYYYYYLSPIDHPAINQIFLKSSPALLDRQFQKEKGKFTTRKSFQTQAPAYTVTKSTCLPLTCYHALVRHAYRPGRERDGQIGDWRVEEERLAQALPTTLPQISLANMASLFVHSSNANSSLDRHVQGGIPRWSCHSRPFMGTKETPPMELMVIERIQALLVTLCHHCQTPSSCCDAIFGHH